MRSSSAALTIAAAVSENIGQTGNAAITPDKYCEKELIEARVDQEIRPPAFHLPNQLPRMAHLTYCILNTDNIRIFHSQLKNGICGQLVSVLAGSYTKNISLYLLCKLRIEIIRFLIGQIK